MCTWRPAPWHHASGTTCLSLRRLLHLEVPSAKERDDPVLLDQFPIPSRMAIVPLPFLAIFACDYRVRPYLMPFSCPRFVVQPSPMGRRNAVPAGERGEQGSAIHRLMLSIDLYCRFVWIYLWAACCLNLHYQYFLLAMCLSKYFSSSSLKWFKASKTGKATCQLANSWKPNRRAKNTKKTQANNWHQAGSTSSV